MKPEDHEASLILQRIVNVLIEASVISVEIKGAIGRWIAEHGKMNSDEIARCIRLLVAAENVDNSLKELLLRIKEINGNLLPKHMSKGIIELLQAIPLREN